MAHKKRFAEVDDYIKTITRGLEFPWYVDSQSGNVRLSLVHGVADYLSILQKQKGFQHYPASKAEDFKRIRSCKLGDYFTYAAASPGSPNPFQYDISFVEILNPELNQFIKEDILNHAATKGITR